jgi:hypothetical protein
MKVAVSKIFYAEKEQNLHCQTAAQLISLSILEVQLFKNKKSILCDRL